MYRYPLLAWAVVATGCLVSRGAEVQREKSPPPSNPAELKIEEALAGPTQVEFVETPLQDVVDYLKDYHKIEIALDTAALNDAGIDSTTTVTANYKGISLESALGLLLRSLKLTWTVHHEVVLITTPEAAAELFTVRIYPVDDLLPPARTEKSRPDFTELETLLRSTVSPKSWDANGGQGALSSTSLEHAQVLVVRQTYPVHREVAQVLARLREPNGGKGRPIVPPPVIEPPAPSQQPATAEPAETPKPKSKPKPASATKKTTPKLEVPPVVKPTEGDDPFGAPLPKPAATKGPAKGETPPAAKPSGNGDPFGAP